MDINSDQHNSNNDENSKPSSWVLSKRYWYWLSVLLPAIPLISAGFAIASGNGLWLWFTVVYLYAVLPLADLIFGIDNANPSAQQVEELSKDRYYVYIMYAATVMHWIALLGMAYVVASYPWSWFNILGASLSAGIINGVALVAGHEMGHKVRDKSQVLCAKLVMACSGYGHFSIEHNQGHHRYVATPDDPASSRMGESIYKFSKREMSGGFRRAWALEAARLGRLGKSKWSLSNEIIQPALVTMVAYILMLALFGPVMIPFLLIAATFGWWQLTSANYVEHYGLLRQKKDNGRFERCQPQHSWNSNHKASNLVLLQLQRHSDHHAHPTRPYQVLRDYPDVPGLPSGYPWMFVVALFPAAWFSLMDPKVAAWAKNDMDKVNLDADSRDFIYSRYHQPETEAV